MPVINGVSYAINNSIIENTSGTPVGTCGANGVVCNVDAEIEGLARNGGSTPTHALRPGSPALDAGAAVASTTDQRGVGFNRVIGSAVDIGAFESPPLTALLPCKLDMDGDNQVSATKEGLVLLRSMLGFSAAAAVNGTGISQGQWDAVRVNLNANCGTNLNWRTIPTNQQKKRDRRRVFRRGHSLISGRDRNTRRTGRGLCSSQSAIEMNQVRVGMFDDLAHYRWSSFGEMPWSKVIRC